MILQKDKKIVLKQGNNWTKIVVICFVMLVLVLLGTSKMWMPDDRVVMSKNVGNTITFTKDNVKVPTEFYRDTSINLGQIIIEEEKSINAIDSGVGFKVVTENGTDFPEGAVIISQGICISNLDNENKCTQKTLIQFGLPKDMYYVKILLKQADNKTEEILLDYRNFVDTELTEKEPNYMANVDKVNVQIAELEKLKQPYVKEKEGCETTLKAVTSEIESLNTSIGAITDTKAKAEKQKVLDVKNQDKDSLQKRIDEQNTFIQDFDKQIDVLREQLKEFE